MKQKTYTEQELFDLGYVYLGVMGVPTNGNEATQLWRWRDELVYYSPELQEITWREYNEPRYQCNYYREPMSNLAVEERRHT
jgi:hypothetical protein